MGIEEAALSRARGERYLHYMARTKRLVPGVY
jgi:protein-S-isoprenylcysteine O-methyltransferase Ste14